MFVQNLHERIRRARMIDIVSTVPTATAIQTPAIIDCTNPQRLAMGAPICFRVRDAFAAVFGNLPSRLK